jgi:hypothetical protein
MGRDTFRKETRRKLSDLQKQLVRALIGPLYNHFFNLALFGIHSVSKRRIALDVTDNERHIVDLFTGGKLEFFVKLFVGIKTFEQGVSAFVNDSYVISVPGIVIELNVENIITVLGSKIGNIYRGRIRRIAIVALCLGGTGMKEKQCGKEHTGHYAANCDVHKWFCHKRYILIKKNLNVQATII